MGKMGRYAIADHDTRKSNYGDLGPDIRLNISAQLLKRGINYDGFSPTDPLWLVVRRIQRQDDGTTPRIGTDGGRVFYHDGESD